MNFFSGKKGEGLRTSGNAKPPIHELVEAVDILLQTAPCDCSHHRRYETGNHLSNCYLFDLHEARARL